MYIPITKPFFDEQEKEYLLKPLQTGWLVQGIYVEEFEKLFSSFTGSKFAKATSNCTTALHLSLLCLDIKSGDKVIVPSFTYIASANVIEYTGAEVVFCDIDLNTFNIDPEKINNILKNDKDKKIKAIIPVNLFGLCSNLPAIIKLAKEYNIKIIEDSACGFGAFINNKHSGTFGEVGCFSFHPRKSITTGEGGMIITDNEKINNMVSSLRDHGASKTDLKRHKDKYGFLLSDFNIRGYNYRMTDLQGALGVSQMKKANYILNKKREIAHIYNEKLKEIEELKTPYIPEGYTHGYQSYVCLFTNGENLKNINIKKIDKISEKRNEFMKNLEEVGISTRQGTHAVHTLGYYKNKYNLSDEDFLNSYIADRLTIALPLFVQMSENEIDYVVKNIKKFLIMK